ncbi:hypothetical protein O6H91_09G014800 [Diphasiastrum complanatum]|uniref:Uncharacterized protein n=1 Tax=Diphasiastrum complanatum TaxID=34168 RepID=A0ACC2CLH7_DIPCM|nr:hypothetical protein O6H91_09G014800 [Diphasiastrum complanatum]
MDLFSHSVQREALQPGDHIYSWRNAYIFAHHGIYVGDGKVIHFTGGRNIEELAGCRSFSSALTSSSIPGSTTFPCEICGTDAESRGVLKSCLDCFLSGFPLSRFEYGTSSATFIAKLRGGTCTTAKSDPSELVLHRANYLLSINGFGCYHVFRNNCEDFAIYCKTGLLAIDRNAIGSSGQATSFLGIILAVAGSILRYRCSK